MFNKSDNVNLDETFEQKRCLCTFLCIVIIIKIGVIIMFNIGIIIMINIIFCIIIMINIGIIIMINICIIIIINIGIIIMINIGIIIILYRNHFRHCYFYEMQYSIIIAYDRQLWKSIAI